MCGSRFGGDWGAPGRSLGSPRRAAGLALLGSIAFGLAWVLTSFPLVRCGATRRSTCTCTWACYRSCCCTSGNAGNGAPRAGDLLTRRSVAAADVALGHGLGGLAPALKVAPRLEQSTETVDRAAPSIRVVLRECLPNHHLAAGRGAGLGAASWRLELAGRLDHPGLVSYAELLAPRSAQDAGGTGLHRRLVERAVLAGCAARRPVSRSRHQTWERRCGGRSVTGHRWWFPLDEARGMLLGTHVGGEPLTPAHGYPVRLVAPGRRASSG